jgi:hypothetical protein
MIDKILYFFTQLFEKNTLNIIPYKADIVLIALNPTEEAIKNRAVFSRDSAFWNLLQRADIISDVSDVPLPKRAIEVFKKQKFSNIRLGFADLLPLVIETDSRNVNVTAGTANIFVKSHLQRNKVKKIALMGQKVVDGFCQDYPDLMSWNAIPMLNGEKDYGYIGNITFKNEIIRVYAMPFPVNNNISNKHIFYNRLLQ